MMFTRSENNICFFHGIANDKIKFTNGINVVSFGRKIQILEKDRHLLLVVRWLITRSKMK